MNEKCLSCEMRISHLRGVCLKCYGVFVNAVRKGTTTWERLEEAGLVRPARKVWPDGARMRPKSGWRGAPLKGEERET